MYRSAMRFPSLLCTALTSPERICSECRLVPKRNSTPAARARSVRAAQNRCALPVSSISEWIDPARLPAMGANAGSSSAVSAPESFLKVTPSDESRWAAAIDRSRAAASRKTRRVPAALRPYSTPVSCLNDCITLSEYAASRRFLSVLRSKFSGAECRRKVIPQPASDGNARRRNCKAESERPTEASRTRQQPGAFHGSGILGVSSEPLAKLVSRPGPSCRSITVTACPKRLKAYAVLTPIRPLPITMTFIGRCYRHLVTPGASITHGVTQVLDRMSIAAAGKGQNAAGYAICRELEVVCAKIHRSR